MTAIEELEKLASEMGPRSPELYEHILSIATRLRTEERDKLREAYVEGRVGNDVDSRPCNCKECLEIQAEAEAEAERRYP
jgi:hypothetical protein